MFDLLEKLCGINSTSGDERDVAAFIINNINITATVIRKDAMGNVLVFKKGKNTPKNNVLFAAHMDEVGFIVVDITEDGYIKFAPVGGIAPSAVFGRKVVFKNEIYGVIGGKPVHLLDQKEKDKQPKIEELFVDIGASNKEEAEKLVKRGDNFYFLGEYSEFGSGKIRSKALDDRIGCAVILDMLRGELNYDCAFAFTVQEEIGARGANAAVYNLEPNICVVLEATTACDSADVSGADKVCELGGGTVVTIMDKGTVYDKELCSIAFETAKEYGLKAQTKTKIAGGNDASTINKALGGIRTVALSAPCRYIHTAYCMVDKRDLEEMRVLAEGMLDKLAEL